MARRPFVKKFLVCNSSETRNGFEFRNISDVRNGSETLAYLLTTFRLFDIITNLGNINNSNNNNNNNINNNNNNKINLYSANYIKYLKALHMIKYHIKKKNKNYHKIF